MTIFHVLKYKDINILSNNDVDNLPEEVRGKFSQYIVDFAISKAIIRDTDCSLKDRFLLLFKEPDLITDEAANSLGDEYFFE